MSDVLCTSLKQMIVVEYQTVTHLFPMYAPARPVRSSADLGTYGNEVDGGPLDISCRDEEGVAGQKLVYLLNGRRLNPEQIQILL